MRVRQSFYSWKGHEDLTSRIGGGIELKQGNKSYVPMSHSYIYELYQPLLVICLRSKSESIRAIACETTQILASLL